MKLYTTCFLLILTIAATAQSYRWERIIGLPHRCEGITDLIEHYDKGFYLEAAHRIPGDIGSGWQVKTDVNGAVLWDKTLMGVDNYVAGEVVSDEDGNRYVAGAMITQQGKLYPFVAKFNACGENVWCRVLVDVNHPYGGVAADIVLNQNNQLIVLLRHSGPSTIDKDYIAAFSLDGDFLWLNVLASLANHPGLTDVTLYHILYHNNAYYLTGVGYYPKPGNPYHWFMRHLFVGLDSLFEEKFFLPYDYQGTMYGISFQSIPLNDTVLMAVGVHRVEGNGTLIFYDINGNEIGHCMIDGSILFPGNISSQLTTIVRADDSLFIAAGFYEPQRNRFRNFDVVLDTSCLMYNFGIRPNAHSFVQLIKTSDGDYLMGTRRKLGPPAQPELDILLAKFDKNLQPVPFDTATYVYDTLCPYPIQSGIVDMSACMVIIVGEGDIPTSREYNARTSTIPIRVFPNPAHDNITFALENTGHHSNIELRCFNLLGVLQYQTRVQRGQQQTTADVSSWPPGMYIVVTYSNGKPVGREKFVVRR